MSPKEVRDLDKRLAISFELSREAYRKFAEKMASMENKKPNLKKMQRAKDLPATQGFVNEIRNELLSRISELEHRMNKRFATQDAKLEQILETCKKTEAEISRTKSLQEELTQNNRAVFDGWDNLNKRMERAELNWIKKFGAEV